MRKVNREDNPELPCSELDTFDFSVFRDRKNADSRRVKLATSQVGVVIQPGATTGMSDGMNSSGMETSTEVLGTTTSTTTANNTIV